MRGRHARGEAPKSDEVHTSPTFWGFIGCRLIMFHRVGIEGGWWASWRHNARKRFGRCATSTWRFLRKASRLAYSLALGAARTRWCTSSGPGRGLGTRGELGWVFRTCCGLERAGRTEVRLLLARPCGPEAVLSAARTDMWRVAQGEKRTAGCQQRGRQDAAPSVFSPRCFNNAGVLRSRLEFR